MSGPINERARSGAVAGAVGIGVNAVLFAAKLLVGQLTASIAITADAFNNLSDAGTSLVTAAAFRMSGKPADRKHPFGHGRVEYVAGLVVSFAIMLVGVELFMTSVEKIFHPQPMQSNWAALAVLVGSVIGKLLLGLYFRRVGKRIQSAALLAAMTDSISDCAATAAVAVAVVLHLLLDVHIDGIMGAAVAVLIFVAGVKTVGETLNPLLGQAPDPALTARVRQTVLSHDGILGVHDLMMHNYGPERYLASLHAEVSADGDMMQSHDLIDHIERELQEQLGVLTVIHMDPIQNNTPRVTELRAVTEQVLREIDPRLTCHDFRIVDGPDHTNLIFDVTMPFNFGACEEGLATRIQNEIHAKNARLFAVVTVENGYDEE